MVRYYEHKKHTNWMDIHQFAKSHGTDWTYVIFGRGGPTGKTHLSEQLRKNGHNVIELTEDICTIVEYQDKNNHFLVYEANKCVVIILNKPLPKHIYPGEKKEEREVARFDAKTQKWFRNHIGTQSTVAQCEKCGLWYKPSLGHKCKKKEK